MYYGEMLASWRIVDDFTEGMGRIAPKASEGKFRKCLLLALR